MAKLATVSIDLSKIDKTKIVDKDGRKYYSVTIAINDEVDQYGNNVSMWQGQSKEETAAKTPKVYLGNGRVFYDSQPAAKPEPAKHAQQEQVPDKDDGFLDLPF